MKIRIIILLALVTLVSMAKAQDGESGYKFLDIPVSAHSAALGGGNVSIMDDDASLMFTNASLLSNVTEMSLTLGYTSYIADSKVLSAGFAKALGERGTWAIGAQVLNYGSMDETDETGNYTGSKFSAKDINVQGSYCYLLSDYWSGAITAKAIMENYGEYSSFAIGTDLSLNYYNEMNGFSFSAVGKNLGGQIDALYDEKQSLPFDLALGMSKEFANAPMRVSLTADDVTHWDDVKFIEHFILGADIYPSRNMWLAVGYNFRRAHEMKVAEKSHGAGLSVGAGLHVKKVKVGVAYGKYHVGASSLLMNFSIVL